MTLRLVTVTLKQANDFVAKHHRHHKPVHGHKFSIGAIRDDELIGVAIAGRPLARALDTGRNIEVTRLCTDGSRNMCSWLLARVRHAAKALGYEKIYTYTLLTEPGSSLRADGWQLEGQSSGHQWSTPKRPRAPDQQPGKKNRWSFTL